ncbi:hypothetical protein N0V82_007838 [Gnomoniopsis sp. IMI 355080]|nr:hypothetical protein N0V82_007838 [Gnomoniopsis sp. IMI 355080]
MKNPGITTFPQFRNLIPEMRLKIWQESLPSYSTVPVASTIKDSESDTRNLMRASDEPLTITWALEAMPRRQWPPELRVRVQAMRNLYNVNFEARQEVIKRFPDVLGLEDGEIRFSPTNDLILLTRYPQLDTLFFHRQLSIAYSRAWNHKIQNLAIEHPFLVSFLANVLKVPSPMTGIGHDLARGFVRFLSQLTNLKRLSLVNPRTLSLKVWNRTPEEQQSHLIQQLGTSYSSGLQMACSTDVPTEDILLYTDGPLGVRDITTLAEAVDNLKRIIRHDSQVEKGSDEEVSGIIRNIVSGEQRLQHLEIRRMYHLSAELQSLCLL